MKYTEKIKFRLIQMPCCGQLLCWVNPRLPSHCPECGKPVFSALKFHGDEHIKINDDDALLIHHA